MKRHLSEKYFDKANLYYDKCIDCKKCLKSCPIIDRFSSGPKTFLNNLMKPSKKEFENSLSCLNCGYCKAVCPRSVDIGDLLYELKKVNVEFNINRNYRKKYRIIKSHQKNSFRKSFINTTSHKSVFFPGCSLSATNPSLVKDIYKLLKNGDIGLFSGCCASPSSISGDLKLFGENRSKIEKEIKDNNIEEIIVACSNCYIALKNIDGLKVTSLYTVLEKNNLIDFNSISENKTFILHDPCPTRYESDIHESTRKLLSKGSIKFEEFDTNRLHTSCCGDGSMVSLLDRDVSKDQLKKRVYEAKNMSIVSYCQSCVNNFRSEDNNSKHILEILLDSNNDLSKKISSLKKWTNRYMLSRYVDKLK